MSSASLRAWRSASDSSSSQTKSPEALSFSDGSVISSSSPAAVVGGRRVGGLDGFRLDGLAGRAVGVLLEIIEVLDDEVGIVLEIGGLGLQVLDAGVEIVVAGDDGVGDRAVLAGAPFLARVRGAAPLGLAFAAAFVARFAGALAGASPSVSAWR